MKRVYMDYASGSNVDPRALEAMRPYLEEKLGNPSSVHSLGQEAKAAIDEARGKVAELIGAEDREIIFTGSATESNNLALIGTALRNANKGKHVVSTTIEHMSVINALKYLVKSGYNVEHVSVDGHGLVSVDSIEKALAKDTALLSVMYANGEVGTIEPIAEIGEFAREKGVYFHVDAVAAAGKIDIDVKRDNIDLLTLSSNDLYGPRGAGALYIRKGVAVQPIVFGGGQERGLRSATENVAGIVGMGAAAEIARKEMKTEAKRLLSMRDRFIKGVLAEIPHSYLNGHPERRLPNNAALRFSYVEGEAVLLHLDMEGIYASTGSACTSKTLEPSHVLTGLGLAHEDAHGSILFTLGRWNEEQDIDYVLDRLPGTVKRLRAMSPFTPAELREAA